jgi:hypothetical protein
VSTQTAWIVEMGQRRPGFRSALDPKTVETIQAPHLPLLDPGGRFALAYGPEGQYSSKVQQRPHCLTRSASARWVRASVNMARSGFCAEFGAMQPSDQVNVYEVNDQH